MGNEYTGGSLLARVDEMIGDHLLEVERVFAGELKSWHP